MNLSGIIAVFNMLGNAIENLQAENAQLREQITMLSQLRGPGSGPGISVDPTAESVIEGNRLTGEAE